MPVPSQLKTLFFLSTSLTLLACSTETEEKEVKEPFEDKLLTCYPEGQRGLEFTISFTNETALYNLKDNGKSIVQEGDWSYGDGVLQMEFPLDSISTKTVQFSVTNDDTEYTLNERTLFGYGTSTTLVPSTWTTDSIPTEKHVFSSDSYEYTKALNDSTNQVDTFELVVEGNQFQYKAPALTEYSKWLWDIREGQLWAERPMEEYGTASICTLKEYSPE